MAMLVCFFPAASDIPVVGVRDLMSAEKSTIPVRTVLPSGSLEGAAGHTGTGHRMGTERRAIPA
jgi:hypothetical protein